MSNRSLFRYSASKYNESLLSFGSLRIGTLHDFRSKEHRQGIVDQEEGKKTVTHHIDYYSPDSNDDGIHSNFIEATGCVEIVNSVGCSVRNFTHTSRFDHEDCFIHCTSFKCSKSVMRQFDGADTCVEIFDPERFYSRLTETLNSIIPVNLVYVGKVKYGSRNEIWNGVNWGESPAIIKGDEYFAQAEVRAIWRPRLRGTINPIVINDVGLIKFCRKINI